MRKHCLMTSAPTDPGGMRDGVAVPLGNSSRPSRELASYVHHPCVAPGSISGAPSPNWDGLAAFSYPVLIARAIALRVQLVQQSSEAEI